MATRLYPITQDPRKLEVLAGVPAGTFEILKEDEKKDQARSEAEKYINGPTYSNAFSEQLANFLTFGWGRMRLYLGYAGSTKNPTEIEQITKAQEIPNYPTELTEGLCWS